MTRSTHPAVAGIPADELFADGCCEGVEAAREYSGLSLNELYDLMDRRKVIPWMWRDAGESRRKVRLIPRRAIAVYLRALYESQPEAEPMARPAASSKQARPAAAAR